MTSARWRRRHEGIDDLACFEHVLLAEDAYSKSPNSTRNSLICAFSVQRYGKARGIFNFSSLLPSLFVSILNAATIASPGRTVGRRMLSGLLRSKCHRSTYPFQFLSLQSKKLHQLGVGSHNPAISPISSSLSFWMYSHTLLNTMLSYHTPKAFPSSTVMRGS